MTTKFKGFCHNICHNEFIGLCHIIVKSCFCFDTFYNNQIRSFNFSLGWETFKSLTVQKHRKGLWWLHCVWPIPIPISLNIFINIHVIHKTIQHDQQIPFSIFKVLTTEFWFNARSVNHRDNPYLFWQINIKCCKAATSDLKWCVTSWN